jgi:hypothetical protein
MKVWIRTRSSGAPRPALSPSAPPTAQTTAADHVARSRGVVGTWWSKVLPGVLRVQLASGSPSPAACGAVTTPGCRSGARGTDRGAGRRSTRPARERAPRRLHLAQGAAPIGVPEQPRAMRRSAPRSYRAAHHLDVDAVLSSNCRAARSTREQKSVSMVNTLMSGFSRRHRHQRAASGPNAVEMAIAGSGERPAGSFRRLALERVRASSRRSRHVPGPRAAARDSPRRPTTRATSRPPPRARGLPYGSDTPVKLAIRRPAPLYSP